MLKCSSRIAVLIIVFLFLVTVNINGSFAKIDNENTAHKLHYDQEIIPFNGKNYCVNKKKSIPLTEKKLLEVKNNLENVIVEKNATELENYEAMVRALEIVEKKFEKLSSKNSTTKTEKKTTNY